MNAEQRARVRGMMDFIDASPTPYHACDTAAALLSGAGFERLEETDAWAAGAGRYYVVRSGSLVAWVEPEEALPHTGLRVAGAHTDSPNLRIKPRPNTGAAGCRQLGVEVYGGVLLNSWLDRDLGLAGRVMVRAAGAENAREVRVHIDRPLLKVPQLAIHLDRKVNDDGLVLDKQQHLTPLWSLGQLDETRLQKFLAAELDVGADEILSFDLMCHDVQKASLLGELDEFVSSPRLDNLCSSYCAIMGMLAALGRGGGLKHAAMVALFDHEEVGSTSHRGAASPLMKDIVERIVLGRGGTREDFHRSIADSFCYSIDMAHATHPNYTARHEPAHWIAMNAGPVIKINTNMRYASDAEGEALFQRNCEEAGVPLQKYSHRSNLACGSTIGPITAAALGMRTLDIGNPQLSMHSIRELCGALDPDYLVRALERFFA